MSQKFCENCGKTNEISAKFCKGCGDKFPVIDHPEYQNENNLGRTNHIQPLNKPVYPTQKANTQSEAQQPQFTGPSQFPPNPNHQFPQQSNPYYGVPNITPPRMWRGRGLIDAIGKMYGDTKKYSGELLEDPKAPSVNVLILIYALAYGLLSLFQFLNMEYSSVDVPSEVEGNFTTAEGRRTYAIMSAGVGAVMVLLLWMLTSWILGSILSGGMPASSYGRYNATRAMRRLTAYLSVPFTIKNLIQVILIQNEDNRVAEISSAGRIPQITIISDFSDQYYSIVFFLSLIAGIMTSIVFYRSLKYGLNNQSSVVTLIAIFIILGQLLVN